MKLKDNALKLRPEEPPDFSARALRVIGQDVADLFPEKLEIEYQGNIFLTHVQCSRERLERQQPKDGWTSFKESLSRNLSDFTAPNAKPETVSFSRTYHLEDINRLDDLGARRRTGSDKLPDIHSLGETLRTVGKLMDAEQGRMIRVFRNQRRVRFEYEIAGGTKCVKQLTSLELLKLQQRYYETRGKVNILDLWKGRD
jgi:hypothetical protein